jgi:hypothetical protein
MKRLELAQMAAIQGGLDGQAVMNCMADAYMNHGWLSVWAFVQTAFIPETAVGIAVGCAIKNA